MEMDWLEEVKDLRAAQDTQYAAARPKLDLVMDLIRLRSRLGLTQAEVARRLNVAPARVSEIELNPDRVSLDRIQAYAAVLGARLLLVMPESPEAMLAATVGAPEIDVKQVGIKLRELAALLQPLTRAGG